MGHSLVSDHAGAAIAVVEIVTELDHAAGEGIVVADGREAAAVAAGAAARGRAHNGLDALGAA